MPLRPREGEGATGAAVRGPYVERPTGNFSTTIER